MSHDSRVAALDGLLEEAGLDAVLATKDASIAYFTGFWGLQLERFFGVAVKRGGAGALIAPSLDRESVAAAPTGLDKALYDAARTNGLPALFETLDGAKRIGVEEDHLNFARAHALTEAGYELVPATDADHGAARGQGRRGGRGRPARLRAHPGRLRRAVGDAGGRRHRGRDQRARRLHARAPRRDAPRAAHPLRRPRRRPARLAGRARAAGGRRRGAPTSPRSSTATGATSPAARTPARRATGPRRRGRSCTRPTSPRSRRRASATPAATWTRAQREIIEAHPDLGACLHGAGHAIGTEVHEPPFLIAELGRAAARGHDLHRRAGDLRLRARRDPARGRRAGRRRRPGDALDHPLELRVLG